MLHILWECGVAQDVWASSNIGLQKQAMSQVDMVQLLEDLLDRISGGKWSCFWFNAGLYGTNEMLYCMGESCRTHNG